MTICGLTTSIISVGLALLGLQVAGYHKGKRWFWIEMYNIELDMQVGKLGREGPANDGMKCVRLACSGVEACNTWDLAPNLSCFSAPSWPPTRDRLATQHRRSRLHNRLDGGWGLWDRRRLLWWFQVDSGRRSWKRAGGRKDTCSGGVVWWSLPFPTNRRARIPFLEKVWLAGETRRPSI